MSKNVNILLVYFALYQKKDKTTYRYYFFNILSIPVKNFQPVHFSNSYFEAFSNLKFASLLETVQSTHFPAELT